MPPRPKARESKSLGEEERPPESSTSRRLTSRTRISAACEACKKRKTKCSGEPLPCQLCQIQGTECVIDLSRDMRRREAMQQTIYDSKSHQDALNDLIDCIRSGSDDTVQSLREFLQRDDISKQEVFDTIRTWAQTTRNQEIEQDGETNVAARSDMGLAYRYHTPLDEAQASRSASKESSAVEIEPSLFEYLRAVHRYLKVCTDMEGVQILNSLLKVRDVAEAAEIIPIDGQNVVQGQGHDRIDPSLQSATMRVDPVGSFWASVSQSGMNTAYSMEDMSQPNWAMSTQIPWTLDDHAQQDSQPQVDGQPQDDSRYPADRSHMFPPRQ